LTLAFAALAYSQAGPGGPSGRGGPPAGGGFAPFGGRFKVYEPAAIARGFPIYQSNCASCHGEGARGKTGPDLIRASVTMHDTDGVQIGEELKTAAHQNAVKLSYPADQLYDIAAFLHSRVMDASGRGQVHTAEVLVGDPKAGGVYFNGAGHCNTCHSVTGDLKGIGDRFDAPTLQERIVMPPRSAGKGLPTNSIKATVTPASGPPVTGVLVRVTDFDVVIRLADGSQQSWTRNHGVPKVETTDPLQAHIDIMRTLKDSDMHNVTAYLAGVK
jgi:cytochrome c oxidase cbb3-type subunit III